MRDGVGSVLRERTAATHSRVEALLGLLDEDLSTERLGRVLARFAGYWTVTERLVDAWAAGEPAAARAAGWPHRRRGALLHADLGRLGLDDAALARSPEPPAPFTTVGEAEVLGWLYVSEGATLGGAVIERALRRRPATAGLRLRSFTPYPGGPGPMWRAYLDRVARWAGDDPARRDAVAAAAAAGFGGLETWLAPLTRDRAA